MACYRPGMGSNGNASELAMDARLKRRREIGTAERDSAGPTDTDKFLWAQSWADDPNYTQLSYPVLGCIVVPGFIPGSFRSAAANVDTVRSEIDRSCAGRQSRSKESSVMV